MFDAPLVKAAQQRAEAAGSTELSAPLDLPWAETLKAAAPIYRRAFWPAHRAANEAWVVDTLQLLAVHELAILQLVTRAYGAQWPA